MRPFTGRFLLLAPAPHRADMRGSGGWQIKTSTKTSKSSSLQTALNEMRLTLLRDAAQLQRFDSVPAHPPHAACHTHLYSNDHSSTFALTPPPLHLSENVSRRGAASTEGKWRVPNSRRHGGQHSGGRSSDWRCNGRRNRGRGCGRRR